MIDKTTASNLIKPLCGLRGYRRGLETLPYLITIASGAQSAGHLVAAVQAWMDEPANQFPTPGEFRAVLNSIEHIYKPGQHGCQLCCNSARMVTDLRLITVDHSAGAPVIQLAWRSESDDTPETAALRAKLGLNQRLVAGARKCECQNAR